MSAAELNALISRLEAVATRLETTAGGAGAASEIRGEISSLRSNPAKAIGGLGAIVGALEGGGVVSGTSVSDGQLSASVSEFDDIMSGNVQNFLTLSKKIGGDVATQGDMVNAAFKAQREYILLASKAKQPPASDVPALLKPTSDKISEIQSFREKQRRSEFFNHLSAVSESIPALGWVTMAPTPGPFVKEMNDAGQFYTNRVLKDWKEKDKTHVEWTKIWAGTLTEIQAYVKKNHTTGLVWNPKGVDAKTLSGSTVPSAPSAGGGPPAPPPPPPPGLFDDIKVAQDPGKAARNNLFADLNKGDGVTQGLKKVSDDMKTHKNPGLRGTNPVVVNKKSPSPAPAAKTQAVQKPPKLELEGKKWIVEYFKGNPNIAIEDVQPNQSVYAFRCEGSTIKVTGKCNNIVLDGCKKSAVVFDDAVSSCEFINCQSVQMQVLGKVPTISIDKTDGCQMYLSKDSIATEIISAKSSEMNVLIPNGEDFVEQPVPEQFKTVVNGSKLKTSVTESV